MKTNNNKTDSSSSSSSTSKRDNHFSGLAYAHRVRIGRASKFILNVGRKRYLAEQGFKPELVLFTRHSLENIALLATKDEPKTQSAS